MKVSDSKTNFAALIDSEDNMNCFSEKIKVEVECCNLNKEKENAVKAIYEEFIGNLRKI